MQSHVLIHTAFDLAAAFASLLMTLFVYHWRMEEVAARIEKSGVGYIVALILGAVVGGFGFGTANLWLSGVDGFGRSILGAFFGAVVFVEVFKYWRGVEGTTGLIFVPAFATSVMIGRWGCFYSGLQDQTYGIASNLPWAVDMGDGVLRHPVQIYESLAMAIFLLAALVLLARRQRFFMANGFYLLAIWYGSQRFVWEFLKPYGKVIGPFNIFHFVCIGLIFYDLWMILRAPKAA
ncbi:MAG TPA: diacylglyceryl transferase [Rhizobiales bacterium]|nr:diacylglyceryl transferase [Hyphomicrobiales bacterium]